MSLYTLHFKKFFYSKVIVFLLVIFIFLILSELLIRKIIIYKDPFNNSVELFWKSLENSNNKSAIFGSSEIARGLLINNNKIYNLALGGEHLALTKVKVERFIKNKEELDLIVLPATATTLNRSYDEAIKKDYRINFFNKKKKPYLYLLMKYHRDYLLRYWSKFLIEKNFFSTVKLLEYGGQVKTVEDNFIPYFKRNDSEKDKMAMKAYLENYEFFYLLKEKSPGYLIYDKLIKNILEKNGKVCLVHMPYVGKYNQLSKNNKWLREEMPEIWRSLESKYQGRVRFLNLSSYVKDDKYFRDATHLTREGGEKYGKLIVNMCLEKL